MKTCVIVSGGLDSITLLYWLKSRGHDLIALSFNYGQRHAKEIKSARYHCKKLGVTHHLIDLSAIGNLIPGSSQTDRRVAVPDGHYASKTMKLTVVPNRNMLMIAAAAAVAIPNGCSRIAYGAHAGDHAIYPDCRPKFIAALSAALRLADWRKIALWAPFKEKDKRQIAALSKKLGVPVDRTWTCYRGQKLHCGTCGSCTERREALAPHDPTRYLA